METLFCRKKPMETILNQYFSKPMVVTRIEKDNENNIYFLTALTIPGLHETRWEYRDWIRDDEYPDTPIKACYGEIKKDGKWYYFYNVLFNDTIFKPKIDKYCEDAIRKYVENGKDKFQNVRIK